jgi:hypothetical protein
MNELINNLRLDAGIAQLKDDPRLVVIDREGNVIDPLIGLEKFAELIVRECAEFVREYPEKYLTRGQANEIGSGIEEHFGVEE